MSHPKPNSGQVVWSERFVSTLMRAWEFTKTPKSTWNYILLSGTWAGFVFQRCKGAGQSDGCSEKAWVWQRVMVVLELRRSSSSELWCKHGVLFLVLRRCRCPIIFHTFVKVGWEAAGRRVASLTYYPLPLSGGWKNKDKVGKCLLPLPVSVSQSLWVKEKSDSLYVFIATNATGPTAEVNSTSLTWSSQLLPISQNLSPLRPTSTHFVPVVNTWAFLTDQRPLWRHFAVSWTTGKVFGSAAESGHEGLVIVWGSGQICSVRGIFRIDTDSQRVWSLFLGYLFTACTHFQVQMVWDPLGFISVSSACFSCLFLSCREGRCLEVERGFKGCYFFCLFVFFSCRCLSMLTLLKSIHTSANMAPVVSEISVCLSLWTRLHREENGDFVLFCLFSQQISGMSWGAQYNLKGPVLEINWHVRHNARSISPK